MQPHEEQSTYWQQPPPVAPWNLPQPPRPRGAVSHSLLLAAVLVLLVINLILTAYVFLFVHSVVSDVHSVSSVFGG